MINIIYDFWNWTGSTNEPGPQYGFWSGFGGSIPDFLIVGSLITFFMHRNCHVKGCLRLGHTDPKHGFPACKKHHSMAKHYGKVPR